MHENRLHCSVEYLNPTLLGHFILLSLCKDAKCWVCEGFKLPVNFQSKFTIMRKLDNFFLLLYLVISQIEKDKTDLNVFIFHLPLDSLRCILLMLYIHILVDSI